MLFFLSLNHTISMKLFLIGLLIGIGKILPGVSGSVIAIRFNIYEKIINSMLYFFHDLKKNSIFLIKIFSGVIIAIVFLAKLVLFFYTKYRFITLIVFAIFILTGLKDIIKECHSYSITLLTFFLSFIIIKIPFNITIDYFFMGIIEAISVIIPGISGTAIFISLGVYEKMLNLFINISFIPLIKFFLGFGISSFILLKVISYLFLKHKKETYEAILGFLFSSIILMFI